MSVTETKEKLLATALDLIWQSNYSSVGVNEICRQAGVTKGAFYHHFESKANLFCEATDYYWLVIKKDLDAIFSPLNTPLQRLENLILFLIKSKFTDDDTPVAGCPFFNVGRQIGTDDEKVVEALNNLASTAIQYNHVLIKSLLADEFIDPVEDTEQLARLMYHFIHGVMSSAFISSATQHVRQDLPEGLYRLVGLKKAYWYTCPPNWQAEPAFYLSKKSA